MSGIGPLFLLLRLKWRGTWRRQFRRLRTAKGLVLTILGVALFGLWFGSLALSLFRVGSAGEPDPAVLEPRVRVAGLVLLALSFSSALSHRGLFLPRDEIERLFSAPVSRAQLVRYRLLSSGLRGLLGSLIVALAAMRRMPEPLLAFVGIMLGMQTLPVLHQLIAILLGGLEKRLADKLRRVGTFLVIALLLACGTLVFLVATERGPEDLPLVGSLFAALAEGTQDPLDLPAIRALGAPLAPWSRMIVAGSWAEFAPWFLASLALWIGLFELTARLPLDFRELSLETSAAVAARIRRARRGGGAAAARISGRTAGWRVPWIFGHNPAGAVAWRKLAAIVRKAKGTFWVSSAVLLLLTALSTMVAGSGEEEGALVVIAGFGTLYLCAGLRFDFRDDLERMEVIKAWPVAPRRLFLAMLAPEACLVSALLIGAVLLRTALAGTVSPYLPAVLLLQPLIVFAWVAVDNAVFLVAPTRMVPGQEGTLQNAGRGLILIFARAIVLFGIALAAGGPAWLAWWISDDVLGWSRPAATGATFLVLWSMTAAADAALVIAGGEALRRFDVARDRG